MIPALSFAQLSDKTNEIYKKLSESKRVESVAIGDAGERSSVFDHYKEKKRPEYYEKLAYLKKKYNSEIIKKYLEFCGN